MIMIMMMVEWHHNERAKIYQSKVRANDEISRFASASFIETNLLVAPAATVATHQHVCSNNKQVRCSGELLLDNSPSRLRERKLGENEPHWIDQLVRAKDAGSSLPGQIREFQPEESLFSRTQDGCCILFISHLPHR